MSSGAPAVTLITGGGSGIGRATALRLAARGDRVALVDIDAGALAETARAIRRAGGAAETYCLDVRDRPAIERLSAAVAQQLGGITYLFSNAGNAHPGPLSAMTLAEWNAVIETHVTGAFHLCQAVLPHMVARKKGAVVLTASDYAVVGLRNGANYAAAKTALYSLTKCLALEFSPHGIRVNAVGPGPIDTPFLRAGRSGAKWDEAERRYRGRVPLGRLGRPEEVAAVVDFLLSDRAAYITGQLLQPNGGQVMW